MVKILIIRTKKSLQNPIVAQTFTILSSRETEKSSHTKKKKKKTDHTPRYLQRTSTQQQSYNPNWRIAKQECTRRPKSKQGKNPLIDMETQQNMPFAIVLTTGHKIVLTRRIKTHSL